MNELADKSAGLRSRSHIVGYQIAIVLMTCAFVAAVVFVVRKQPAVDVTVVFSQQLVPKLRTWRNTLGSTLVEQDEWYRRLIRFLESRLTTARGIPADACPNRSGDSTIYFWNALPELVVVFRIHDTPPEPRCWWDVTRRMIRLRRGIHRRVVIIDWILNPRRD